MKARIQRLRAEVASDRSAVEHRLAEIEEVTLPATASAGDLARVAVALHHAYGAVEAALVRIARTLGEGLPEGSDWHQELLHVMALDVEGVRPAVLGSETVTLLLRLLAFRHFFRHAYAVPLDAERLSTLRSDALTLRAYLLADFARLDAFLQRLASAADD